MTTSDGLKTPKTGPDLQVRPTIYTALLQHPCIQLFELSSEGGNVLVLEIRTLKLRERMGFGQGCGASKGRDGCEPVYVPGSKVELEHPPPGRRRATP